MKRDTIWMIQVREKRGNHYRKWGATCTDWFNSRTDAREYLRKEVFPHALEGLEYRVTKYVAERD